MEKPVIEQLVCAVISIGGGISFGVIYDFFKALRLKAKNVMFSAIADIIVCLLGLNMLFLLFMSIGYGEARLYIVLCALAGALVYFIAASRILLEFFMSVFEVFSKIIHKIIEPLACFWKLLKKSAKKVKIFFQKACKRFTIILHRKGCGPQKKQAAVKEHDNEAQTRRSIDKNRDSRSGDLRGSKPVLTETKNRGRSGKAR